MTNEEMVIRIKQGEKDLYLDLWKNVQPFVRREAGRKARSAGRVDLFDDLLQESFIQLYPAVEWYDETSGKTFLSCYADYFMKDSFNAVFFGGKTNARRQDPINNHADLFAEISGTEDLYIADMIPDESAAAALSAVEDRIYSKQINDTLTKAIYKVIEPIDIQNIMLFHLNTIATLDQGRQIVAPGLTYGEYKNRYHIGLRCLRRHFRGRRKGILLGSYERNTINTSAPLRGGVRAYRENLFTSSTERVALHDLKPWEKIKSIEQAESCLDDLVRK